MCEEVEGLEHHADVGTQLSQCRSFGGQFLPSMVMLPEVMVSSRLIVRHRVIARTGRSDDDDDLTFGDIEIDVLQCVEVAVVLLDVAQGHQWW